MSRRSLLKKHQVLKDANSASLVQSESTDISGLDFIQYHLEVGALVVSTFEIQFCNDDKITSISSWKPLDFGQVTNLNGAQDTSYLVLIENRGFKYIRIALTGGTGSGLVNAWISGNVRGA